MLKLITGPAAELITLSDIKVHLRVSGSSEDDLLTSMIKTARRTMEAYTGRALITQTWEQYFDKLPNEDFVTLQKAPVQSITSISYWLNDTSQTFTASYYNLDDSGIFPRVYLDDDRDWPSLDNRRNAVTIRFVAGYGDAATKVPEEFIHACRLLVGFMYENRDDRISRSPFKTAALPTTVSWLLNPFRLWEF